MTSSSLNVTAIVNEEVAAVEINGVTLDGYFHNDLKGVGWAKRHPTDAPNPEISFHLAISRALQDLATQYARAAADIAGFPVVVDLSAVDDAGEPAAVIHYPHPTAGGTTEKVAY